MNKRLSVIAGPTASGKTALAVAVASRLNGEVVSADSMQVYADLQIGTARPSEEEMQGVLHHLIGFLPLTERYSVARYAADARAAIDRIQSEGKHPILCGGTGLYIQAVTENLAFSEESGDESLALRHRLQEECAALGGEVMRERLRAYDPETAEKLHPNDHGRIIRALEVVLSTGVPMSEWVRRSREIPPPYDTRMVVLDFRERRVLYDRIDRRVDIMLEQGLLAEAERVLCSPNAPTAMQAIGYKELAPYFSGVCSLEQAVENLKRETRRYAKRQLSWFRRIQTAHTIYVDDYDDAAKLTAAAEDILRKERAE
ncbi:MAG: tRNA (adenosine(37)-N6)-dimethylallyltransferase MiaA [Ruminococcaceae bacterium]|nr:tRNA (adenosine(37)-N6)-dimethylallyltransferase MiaA [Oscillospiraceae bacterium]